MTILLKTNIIFYLFFKNNRETMEFGEMVVSQDDNSFSFFFCVLFVLYNAFSSGCNLSRALFQRIHNSTNAVFCTRNCADWYMENFQYLNRHLFRQNLNVRTFRFRRRRLYTTNGRTTADMLAMRRFCRNIKNYWTHIYLYTYKFILHVTEKRIFMP